MDDLNMFGTPAHDDFSGSDLGQGTEEFIPFSVGTALGIAFTSSDVHFDDLEANAPGRAKLVIPYNEESK